MARASIGSLVVSLGLDAGEYFTGLDKAEYNAKKMAASVDKGFKALGGIFSIAATAALAAGAVFVATAASVLQAGDEAVKASQKFGLTAESYQELVYAGKLADVSSEALGVGLKKLNVAMTETQANTGETKDVFRALGLSVTDAGGKLKATDQVFLEIADKFSQMEDGAGKTALAVKIFGRAGSDLIPLLNSGARGLRENAEEARKFGIIIDNDAAKKMEVFNDNVTRFKELMKGFATSIVVDALPALNRFLEQLLQGTAIAGGFFSALRLFGLSNINLDNAGDKVVEFTAKIKELEASREKAEASGRKGFGKFVDPQIADLKKQIEFAQLLQKQSDQRTFGNVQTGFTSSTRKPAPKIVDTDKANKEAEAAAKAYERYLDTIAKLQLDTAKDVAQRESAILEAQRQANLVGDQDYYQKKAQIAKTSLDLEQKILSDQILRQQQLADKQVNGTKEYHEEQSKLQELLAKRNKLELDGKNAVELLGFAQKATAKAYANEIEGLKIQLLELQGKTEEAAKRQFRLSTQGQRERFESNKDSAGLELLNNIERSKGIQVEFNESREKADAIIARLQLSEERLQNVVRAGGVSEIETLRRTGELRRQAADALEEHIANLERAGQALGNDKLILQAEQARVALERLRAESEVLADKFNDIFRSSAADALTDFFDKTKTAKEAFDDFSNSVIRGVNRMVAEALAADLGKALGITGNGPGGGIGGVFAGLFGGSGSSGGSAKRTFGDEPDFFGKAASSASGFIGDIFGKLGSFFGFEFASGTRNVPRDMYAKLHKGERVVSANENFGGASMIEQRFYIDGTPDRRTQDQILMSAARGARRVEKRDS